MNSDEGNEEHSELGYKYDIMFTSLMPISDLKFTDLNLHPKYPKPDGKTFFKNVDTKEIFFF